MEAKTFLKIIGSEFYTGVPDSLLSPLCDCLADKYGINSKNHIVAANEGNTVAIGAGYHLATGKIPAVYLQNSGEGNIVNPVASLLSEKVYGIPMIFIIGWRGEPGVHDEPQHIFQGEITLKLLDVLDISYIVLDRETSEEELKSKFGEFENKLNMGKSVAIVVKKGALAYNKKIYKNENILTREEVIRRIVSVAKDDFIIATTGKAGRELFEIREETKEGHGRDFLTVGSMGHCSSIALGVALQKPDKKIWCIDGDGAAIMHIGAMAVIGNISPDNLIHILINNKAHESVGGIPTAANTLDFLQIAQNCGYKYVKSVNDMEELEICLKEAKNKDELSFIEVKTRIFSRKDLGRPTVSARENKVMFGSSSVEVGKKSS